ncbi:MAG: hypothetical protein V4697_02820 [Patescibacteria group bacterium]
MPSKHKNGNGLTPKEQKTTAAFKLMAEKVKILEKSLKTTQDELENYRGKYHEADKTNAVQVSRNHTLIFHEILKFVVSVVCGGVGVNLLTNNQIEWGAGIIVSGIILYTVIVFSDRYKKHEPLQ